MGQAKSGETDKAETRGVGALAAGILPDRVNPYWRKGDSAQAVWNVAQYTGVPREALAWSRAKIFLLSYTGLTVAFA
ncbi:hypothetical protein NDK50_17190 [Paraburkholderia bryophila]|uniref:hypothetical protein n=1 Tax=Paraburkholderia bryophila TaxID=420952 RepID=UPI00234BB8CA|nr:hypothetical protein [Paraburkholderia bryophila]WCM19141.1 hypothetical protein NDK50_17190 [Paraburkholderia bryophila]